MYRLQRKLLSQNFLYSRKLVKKLVGSSSIGSNDLVLEVGPRKGIITEELVKKAKRVVAVEIDCNWYNFLKIKFAKVNNLTLYHQDFLNFCLPREPYKVFANIPFSIEGKIIRRLIDAPNPPRDCYLVIRKKLACRLSGLNKENQFSITHQPFFDFSIVYHFRRTDYEPMTSVDTVLFRFSKRVNSLIPFCTRGEYQKFVKMGFGQGLQVYKNLQKRFLEFQLKLVFRLLKIDKDTKPSYLPLDKWLELYTRLALRS